MKTQCPNCKSKFNVNEASIGKQAKCPKCTTQFTIAPFVETPVVAAPPVKNPEPAAAEPPVNSPEYAVPAAKITAPAEPQQPAAAPMKSPAPIAPPPVNFQPAKQEPQPESKMASKQVLSKTIFVYGWMIARIIAGILGVLGVVLAVQKGAKSTLIATFAAADVFLVCSTAIELMLFYKMWAAIKDGQASISPGKAVGFLFIPVFNIYWALLMLTGFTEDYNSFIIRRSIRAKKLSMTLFLIYAVLFMSAVIFIITPMLCIFPFTGLISRAFEGYALAFGVLAAISTISGIGHFITYFLVASRTCDAVNVCLRNS